MLQSQGLEPNQPVRFLSDGGDTVRKLQMWLSPQSEHLLDWFHVTMRLTVMGQLGKAVNGVETTALVEQVEKDLASMKWHLWNRNVDQALEHIAALRVLLADDHLRAERQKLLKAVRDSEPTLPPTKHSSPTTVIATPTTKRSRRRSWSRFSITYKCTGPDGEPICCCRSGLKS